MELAGAVCFTLRRLATDARLLSAKNSAAGLFLGDASLRGGIVIPQLEQDLARRNAIPFAHGQGGNLTAGRGSQLRSPAGVHGSGARVGDGTLDTSAVHLPNHDGQRSGTCDAPHDERERYRDRDDEEKTAQHGLRDRSLQEYTVSYKSNRSVITWTGWPLNSPSISLATLNPSRS
jgi:hypothetical protein